MEKGDVFPQIKSDTATQAEQFISRYKSIYITAPSQDVCLAFESERAKPDFFTQFLMHHPKTASISSNIGRPRLLLVSKHVERKIGGAGSCTGAAKLQSPSGNDS